MLTRLRELIEDVRHARDPLPLMTPAEHTWDPDPSRAEEEPPAELPREATTPVLPPRQAPRPAGPATAVKSEDTRRPIRVNLAEMNVLVELAEAQARNHHRHSYKAKTFRVLIRRLDNQRRRRAEYINGFTDGLVEGFHFKPNGRLHRLALNLMTAHRVDYQVNILELRALLDACRSVRRPDRLLSRLTIRIEGAYEYRMNKP